MGMLVDGHWQDRWYDTASSGGRFVRSEAVLRNWITAEGTPGPSGGGGYRAEPDRYHLYVSYACPWAHRTLIYRQIKGLTGMIGLSVTHWHMAQQGWTFETGDGVVADPIHHARYVHQIYQAAAPGMSGRCTVPILWDRHTQTLVSNESSEIIRMFNRAFDGCGASVGDYYPEALRAEIDAINERVYHAVNNGVYRAGFATTQAAYEEAVVPLFETLDDLEHRLSTRRYLCGAHVTECDWRLLPTLLRFDLVYHGHFKCNLRRLADYPNLWAYTRDLYQQPGIAQTCNFFHTKQHYYGSHESVNPSRIVPIGPVVDFMVPHGRERLGAT